MATKLQELLEELKSLKRFDIDLNNVGRKLYSDQGDLVRSSNIEELITKYTETTTTYKPGDEVLITKSCLKTLNGTKGYLIRLHSSKEKLWKIKHSLGICYFSEEEFEPIN